jgi:hypothetical protein
MSHVSKCNGIELLGGLGGIVGMKPSFFSEKCFMLKCKMFVMFV